MDPELLRQVWPVFSVEAREQLAVLGGGLLQLESSADRAGLVEPIRRTAHSLKGAAGSLGITGVERLVHALEGALAGYDPGEGLGAEVVLAGLDALEAIERALAAGDAGQAPEVARLEARLEWLAAVSPRGPGAPPAPIAASTLGSIDESLHYAMDYDLWLRFARLAEPTHVPRRLANFRVYRNSKTGGGYREGAREALDIARRRAQAGEWSAVALHRLHYLGLVATYSLLAVAARDR